MCGPFVGDQLIATDRLPTFRTLEEVCEKLGATDGGLAVRFRVFFVDVILRGCCSTGVRLVDSVTQRTMMGSEFLLRMSEKSFPDRFIRIAL